MNNFQVYKSSAGSGKTYTLISVYLGIVLREPASFRNILAITFTNKAANEIKSRIISNLKIISADNPAEIPVKFNHMVESLKTATGLETDELRKRAATALSLILHSYGDFAVSTIDSFMHRIIRAFSFDLKLSMSFDVEMDKQMLQSEAVGSLLSDVGRNEYVTGILVKFVQERAEADENWQIDNDLIKFSNNLFDEDAFGLLPRLSSFDAEKLDGVNRKLNRLITAFESELKLLAGKALALIHENGLQPEWFFQGNRGIYGFFSKIAGGDTEAAFSPNSYVEKTITGGDWLSARGKKEAGTALLPALQEDLSAFFNQIRNLAEEKGSKVLIYNNIRSNLYPLAVLGELNQRLQVVKKERNVISIAEFNRIIAGIVSNEPVPFIYERTGEKFRHYLIDEFQDTSVLQWHNLLPLLENSLSHNYRNMIVGDGKQAIYRFRNGEVEQFVKLPDVNNPDNNPLIGQRAQVLRREYQEQQLDTNFRSGTEVVEFNNRFFDFASGIFVPEFEDVYRGGSQKSAARNSGGFVSVEFLSDENRTDAEINCERVLQIIHDVIGAGYQHNDITVLCRSNSNASEIAGFLNSNDVGVVSSESLLLSKSPEVNFLINLLKVIADADNGIARIAVVNYLLRLQQDSSAETHRIFSEVSSAEGFFSFLADSGFGFTLRDFRGLSLYDTVEELIRVFDLQKKSPVYLQFFLDEVLKVTSGPGASPAAFLEYWEQQRQRISVVLPQSPDAVQIMTIHKSKGLEFPVVIYAFADDDASRLTKKTAWVELDDPDLPELGPVMLRLDKKLEKTKFAGLYLRESSKSRLDLLNLIYVAFTRASERLYILAGKLPESSGAEPKSVTALLAAYLHSMGLYQTEKTVYIFGDPATNKVPAPAVVHSDESEPLFHSADWRSRLIFAARAPGTWQADAPERSQARGNLLHQALSFVDYPERIPWAVNKLIQHGLIETSEADEIAALLRTIVNHPEVKPFFSEDCEVITEKEILTPEGKNLRPDRVVVHKTHTDVIDFKTGLPSETHQIQVLQYASVLSGMGYPDVRAWLLYLEDAPQVVRV